MSRGAQGQSRWGNQTRRSVASPAGHVVVSRGGPAGTEAAVTAAEDGCDVILLERSDRVGGRLALAGERAS